MKIKVRWNERSGSDCKIKLRFRGRRESWGLGNGDERVEERQKE